MSAIVNKGWGDCGLLGIQVDPPALSQHHANHSTAARWLSGTADTPKFAYPNGVDIFKACATLEDACSHDLISFSLEPPTCSLNPWNPQILSFCLDFLDTHIAALPPRMLLLFR